MTAIMVDLMRTRKTPTNSHFGRCNKTVHPHGRCHGFVSNGYCTRCKQYRQCCNCKRTRMPDGTWQHVEIIEGYDITTGICPDCRKALYPEFAE